MFSPIIDTSLNTAGYIHEGIIHDNNGRVVGYVLHNDIYRGIPPNGQLAYTLDTMSQDNLIYKTTPSSRRSGYEIELAGFLKGMGKSYKVYKRRAEGQGQLIGIVGDVDDMNIAAGAVLLLL
jgi:hypothetical protein